MSQHSSRRIFTTLLGPLFVLAAAWLLSACGPPPPPCGANWIGPADGDFNVAGSWSTGTVPDSTTVACAPVGSSIVVSDTRAVSSAQLAGTVNVTATGTFAMNQDTSTIGALTLAGTLAGDGPVTITTLAWTGGKMMDGGATTVLQAPTTITAITRLRDSRPLTLFAGTITSPAIRICDSANLTIAGQVTITAGTTTQINATTCGPSPTGTLTIAPTGTLTIASTTTIERPVTNTGTIRITGATTVDLAGAFAQPQGMLDLSSAAATLRVNGGAGTLAPTGGTIAGYGTLNGSLAGISTVSPGSGDPSFVGTLTITGDYAATAGTHVAIDLAGTTPGVTYDQLIVGGSANLAGTTLDTTYASGFTPSPPQAFTPVTSTGTLSGPLAGLTNPGAPGQFSATYGPNALTLTVNATQPLDLTVNSTGGLSDANPGDGLCETTTPGQCTLWAALAEANAAFGADTITLQAGASYPPPPQPALAEIRTPLTLHANGSAIGIGLSASAALTVMDDVDVDVDHLIATEYAASSIDVKDPRASLSVTDSIWNGTSQYSNTSVENLGSLTLQRVTIRSMSIYNHGTLTIARAGLANSLNGIRTFAGSVTSISESTLTGNGRAISNAGTTVLTASTVVDNDNVGIDNSGTFSMRNSIVATEGAGLNCTGAPIVSLGWNLSDDASCSLTAGTDLASTPAGLGTHGTSGTVYFRQPLPGSAAVDSGPLSCAGTDLRGQARPTDGDGDGTATCDRGAVELGPVQPLAIQVNTTVDDPDIAPGDGSCETAIAAACSLRAAVEESSMSNGPDTIDLQSGASYVTSSSLPHREISSDVAIRGHASTVEVGPSGAAISFRITGLNSVSIEDLTAGQFYITSATVSFDRVTARGFQNYLGTATFTQSHLTTSTCGARSINGSGATTTMIDSRSELGFTNHGHLELQRTTVACDAVAPIAAIANIVRNGGGPATVIVTESTLANFSTGITGDGSATVESTTIDVSSNGTGIGPTTLSNSIIATLPGGTACSAPVASAGWNIASDTSCSLTDPTDLNDTDPHLARTQDYGGGAPYARPSIGSPAIDTGRPGCNGTDLIGHARPIDGDGDGSALCDRGSVEAPVPISLTLAPNSTRDLPDDVPGDQVCSTATPGECTLRAAVMEANSNNGLHTIDLAANTTYTLGYGTNEDLSAEGDLDLATPITIHGNGATIDATGGLTRAIHVIGAVPVAIDDVHIDQVSEGIVNPSGSLTLTTVTLTNVGTAIDSDGTLTATNVQCHDFCSTALDNGGTATLVYASIDGTASPQNVSRIITNTGSVSMVRSTIFSDDLTSEKAYYASATTATLSLYQSTISGSGLDLQGSSLAVTNSTFHTWASPIITGGGAAIVTNSVLEVYGNPSGSLAPACEGVVQSGGWNVVADSSCNFVGTGDLQNTPPLLLPLAFNSGPTPTFRPSDGSPAIDSGKPGCSGIDQRGRPRPTDGDGDSTALCDRGAVEAGQYQPLSLTVNATTDRPDALFGDGVCQTTTAGECTLRAAIEEANESGGPDTVSLQSGTSYIIDPARGPLSISSGLTLSGNAATIDGQGSSRLVDIPGTMVATINDLTFTGSAPAGSTYSGALRVAAGADITLSQVVFTANQGSGIENFGHVSIIDSRIEHNTAASFIPILNRGNAEITGTTIDDNTLSVENYATLELTASTISHTLSSSAIYAIGSSYTTIRSSTLSGNGGAGVVSTIGSRTWVYDSTITANTGGGISAGDVVAVVNSIVANQVAGANCWFQGNIWNGTYNVSSDASCGFTAPTDLQNTDPNLGALADNGGPTLTHLPNAGSPVIDTGRPGCPATDQRGAPRPNGAACDRGAVER